MASNKKTAPYGTWPGEITETDIASKSLRFGTVKSEGAILYWVEQRASEGGRGVIMQWSEADGLCERLEKPHSARSKVHEYGGGDFCVHHGEIYYVNAVDQQIYHLSKDGEAEKITNASGHRFADLVFDEKNNRLIAVSERHETQKQGQKKKQKQAEKLVDAKEAESEKAAHPLPQNMLVQIGLTGEEKGGFQILEDKADFYASPRISPDGSKLAFLSWSLPDMPWQSAQLKLASLNQATFSADTLNTNAASKKSAAFSPYWSAAGELYFIEDINTRGQLMKGTTTTSLVSPQDDQLDALMPQWVFGLEAITITTNGELFLTGYKNGACQLHKISENRGVIELTTPARSINMLTTVETSKGQQLAAITTTDKMAATICLIDIDTGSLTPIRPETPAVYAPSTLSIGQLKSFTSEGAKTFGIYYPPSNSAYHAAGDEAPPTILTVHGGPTAMADRGLKLNTQYWTSRGYAIFDVDYAGSSGYGRAYRERLDGRWGQRDVKDLIAAAEYLIDEKLADPEKLIIQGGSAGGYTCLMALVESNLFKCASVNYPVTDLSQLLEITHKFELGYTYSLTGTTEATAKTSLAERSVLKRVKEITAPVIFFQGLEDKVVPPSQPKAIYEGLKARGIKTSLHEFIGEGHGFRKADTITTRLQKELAFYQQVLNLNT